MFYQDILIRNIAGSIKFCVKLILILVSIGIFIGFIIHVFSAGRNSFLLENGLSYIIPDKLLSFVNKSTIKQVTSRRKPNCSINQVQKTGGFCIDINNINIGGSNLLDAKVCRGIEELVGESSVVDFGAGLGQYGRCLLRNWPTNLNNYTQVYKNYYKHLTNAMSLAGILNKSRVIKSWEGFDGGLNAEDVSENFVKYMDLSKPFDLKKKFDWVVSLSVGEHIPVKFESTFIDNVVKHAKKGIVLSWGTPGQGGHGHVNNRPNKYIIDKVTKKDFIHDKKGQDMLRKNTTYSWFAPDIMVFRKSLR